MVNYEDISGTAVVATAAIPDVKEGIALARNSSGEVVLTDGTNTFTGVAYDAPINGIVSVVRWGIVKAYAGTGTFTYDTPLKAGADGKFDEWVSGTDAPELLIAKVEVPPDTNGIMEIRLGGGV